MMRLALLCAAGLLAACSALPDKPVAPTLYDFGPPPAAAAAAAPTGPPLVLEDVEVAGSFEGSGLMYRLAYADANRVQPYAYARWSAPAAQLLRQRVGEVLARERPVLDASAAASLARRGAAAPQVLRLELQEFSQVFASPQESRGVVRVRASLLENAPGGERLAAQRSFSVESPAPTPDAAGGVKALTAATDAAARQVVEWLRAAH